MNFSKVVMGLALVASFGLVACGDDSSSSSSSAAGNDSDIVSCKIKSEEPFKIAFSYSEVEGSYTLEFKDGKLTETSVEKFSDQKMADEECAAAKEFAEDEVSCDGKTVTSVTTGESSEIEYAIETSIFKTMCEAMDGKSAEEWKNKFEEFDDDDEDDE